MIPEDKTPKSKPGEQIAERMQSTYQWWDNLSKLNAKDPLWLGALKIGVRAIGILIMLALSPFIIFGFIFAIMAAA